MVNRQPKAGKQKMITGEIPTAGELTGIELRMLPPFIKENGTTPVFPFPGNAKLYCLVMVVSDANNQLIGGIDLQGFPRIGDKEHLPINKTLFYWEPSTDNKTAPRQIHMACSIIKCKQSLRDVAKILTSVKSDEDYKGVVKTLEKLAKNASGATLFLDALSQLGSLVGKYLKDVEDKPLGAIVQSYTALRGDFDNKGVQRRQYMTPRVMFDFELVVRDKTATPVKSIRGGKKSQALVHEEVIVDLQPFKS
ncbi:hypothetical protein KJS94_12505 [Flavihumibacter rivuli]|uniref:hypothetical protein n=1 Tax=Flavihumibacter rivuli TaxID=2838156 RepID=UPI001BDEE16E|nr:hypothetical protein [Flavihumibacter rivuli]ULQ55464.1 hypothetical protein KJS94_12505 [Flavihumibacter rivuli]